MLNFENIFCVVKISELNHHYSTPESKAMFKRLRRVKRDKIAESHDNQTNFIKSLKFLTRKAGLNTRYIYEKDTRLINPRANDLVLSCGGDGTFLSCAQKYENSFLLGMNSDYKPKAGFGSYGALTSINRANLEKRLMFLREGNFYINKWKLLQVKINDRLVKKHAVNDIYFGQESAYETCDITVLQGGQEEDFSCSGLLCCTGMGSHAWHYNAGGSPFSNDLDVFGFTALFPNLKRPLKFVSGIISSKQELVVYPEGHNYILSFDSKSDVIKTKLGDKIDISLVPDKALKVISFFD